MSSLFETAAWVGPAVAGVLIVFGIAWSYLVSGLCLLCCLGITLFLPHDAPSEPATREPGWRTLSAGLRFVFGSPLLVAAMTLDLLAVLLGGATYLMPIFAERLGVGSIGYGWMRAAPALRTFFKSNFNSRAAASRRFNCESVVGLVGLTRIATRRAVAITSTSNWSRFGLRSTFNEATPVILPAG
jgi:hypothetical protein